MRFHRTPLLLQWLFPQFTWRVRTTDKILHLTFDDGPVPEVTGFVLQELARYEAKATFFCVGDNIRKHPALAERLLHEGHRIANHSHNHLSGWQTPADAYLNNVELCQRVIEKTYGTSEVPRLFRPPYGKISLRQAMALHQRYQLVMWDVLSYDFDPTLSPTDCLHQTIASTRPGSIVVFHDNVKALDLLRQVLPEYLEHMATKGYKFHALW